MNPFQHKVVEHLEKMDAESVRRQFRALTGDRDFFESVCRVLSEGVVVADAQGVLLYANAAAGRFCGFDPAQAHGKTLARVLPDLDWDRLLARDEPGWKSNRSREIEVTYPERRILELEAVPNGEATVVLLRDVTAEQARTADALESGRADAIKDLASGVAHEIGNPLNALALNLDMLVRSVRKEPESDRRTRLLADLETARTEVRRIDGINRGFLKALRPVAPDLAPGSLADPLKNTLAEMKTQFEDRRIQVTLDLPPALPPVALDRAQMEQVFFNLVKNALEAMKDGGHLAIELASDDRDVSVAFRDDGGGMSDETVARLFEPYRTTKITGNGLGLMICRRIVRAHGGEIDVSSKEGAGTCFIVRLPRLEKRIRRLT